MIPEIDPYNNYRGDGVATQFDYDFFIQNGSQLIVEKIDKNDVVTRLERDIDYEIVEIDGEFAGYIKFPIENSLHGVLQNDEILSLQLDLPFHQDSEYGQSSLLDLNSLEFSLDYLTRLCQILKRQLERSVKVNEGSESTPDELLESINNSAKVSTNAANLAVEKANEANESASIAEQKTQEVIQKGEEIIVEGQNQISTIQQVSQLEQEEIQEIINRIDDGKAVYIGNTAPTDEIYSVWVSPEDNDVALEIEKINEKLDNVSNLYLGQTIFSLDPLFEDTLHLLDGALLSVGGMYNDFITKYIANLYSTNPERFCTEEEYQASLTNYGVCGKYVYTEGVSVRLPKVTGIVEGTLDANALGEIVEAGLPNITGTFALGDKVSEYPQYTQCLQYSEGAFYSDETSSSSYNANGQAGGANIPKFDASRCSSIYKDNFNKVQPQTIQGYYYIVVATGSKTDVEVNLDNIATDLNGKADRDLTNISQEGKSTGASLAMPSSQYIDLEWGANGAGYTAPASGWVVAKQRNKGAIGNTYLQLEQTGGGAVSRCVTYLATTTQSMTNQVSIPVKKGSRFYIGYGTVGTADNELLRFYYAEGEV